MYLLITCHLKHIQSECSNTIVCLTVLKTLMYPGAFWNLTLILWYCTQRLWQVLFFVCIHSTYWNHFMVSLTCQLLVLILLLFYKTVLWRHRCLVVTVLNSGLSSQGPISGWEHCVTFLGKTLDSHSVSFCLGVLMCTTKFTDAEGNHGTN